MERRVEGSYETNNEAMQAVHRLQEEGYKKSDILLVANEKVKKDLLPKDGIHTASESSISGNSEDNRSFWEKIKDAFTVEEYDAANSTEEDPLYSYHDDLDRGAIIVLVNEKKEEKNQSRTKAVQSRKDEDVFHSEDNDFAESMGAVTSTGTGEYGSPIQRAATDDIEASKSNNALPGRDGDVFHTDELQSDLDNSDKSSHQEHSSARGHKRVMEIDSSLHLDDATDPDTSKMPQTESTLHANPDVPMDTADALDRSSLSTDKVSPELTPPLDEEVSRVDETVSQNAPLGNKILNVDVDKNHIGTSPDDDMNKHI